MSDLGSKHLRDLREQIEAHWRLLDHFKFLQDFDVMAKEAGFKVTRKNGIVTVSWPGEAR